MNRRSFLGRALAALAGMLGLSKLGQAGANPAPSRPTSPDLPRFASRVEVSPRAVDEQFRPYRETLIMAWGDRRATHAQVERYARSLLPELPPRVRRRILLQEGDAGERSVRLKVRDVERSAPAAGGRSREFRA